MIHSVDFSPFAFANALIAAFIALPSCARASSVNAAPCVATAASLSASTSIATTFAPKACAIWTQYPPTPPAPTTTARVPGATPARHTAWYGVVSASATIDTSASVRPTFASRASSTSHSPRPGTTMCEANPPSMSLPGIFCARQMGASPRRQRSHSPHGSTAGTITALPIQPSAPVPGRDDAPADLVAERERQWTVGPHAVVVVAEIGVAHAAAGDRDDDFACARRGREGDALQWRLHRGHDPPAGFDAHAATPPGCSLSGQGKDPAGGYCGITVP